MPHSVWNFDWTRFTLEIFIRSTPERVFASVATPSGIRSWFRNHVRFLSPSGEVRSEGSLPQAGDRLEWSDFPSEELGPDRFIQVIPGRSVGFFFDSESVEVTFEVLPAPGGSVFRLTQEGMPDTPKAHATWHLSCRAGWTFRMVNLKSVLETSKDLRESDPALIFKPGHL